MKLTRRSLMKWLGGAAAVAVVPVAAKAGPLTKYTKGQVYRLKTTAAYAGTATMGGNELLTADIVVREALIQLDMNLAMHKMARRGK